VPVEFSKRLYAWAMGHVAQHYDALLADRKASLTSGIRGTIVEIGPGTGANFRHYSRDIHWIGAEPNPHMHLSLYWLFDDPKGPDAAIVADQLSVL
jgi:hypothetical protein